MITLVLVHISKEIHFGNVVNLEHILIMTEPIQKNIYSKREDLNTRLQVTGQKHIYQILEIDLVHNIKLDVLSQIVIIKEI